MRNGRVLLLVLAMAFASGGLANETERQVRMLIMAHAERAVMTGDVRQLEGMAAEFLGTKAKTPAGVWKLVFLYEGIENAVTQQSRRGGQAGVDHVLGQMEAWQKAFPKSTAAQVAKGSVLQKGAWLIRGHGTASTVPDDAWKPFQEGIEVARQYLESVKATASANPQEEYRVRVL